MSANDRQEGGNHYKQVNAPQHWDLVVAYQWDYFQSQITKYLMRWKSKHPTNEKKLEDLKKARHFLDKYIENYEKFLGANKLAEKVPMGQVLTTSAGFLSDEFFQAEGGWGTGLNLYTCRACRKQVRALDLTEARRLHPCPRTLREPLQPLAGEASGQASPADGPVPLR